MDRLEAAKYIKAHCLGSEVCRDGTRWNDAMVTAVEALEQAPTFDWLMKKADEWGMVYGKQFLIEAQRAWKEGKDIDVPTNSALDHIHNVVAEREYQRGYKQAKEEYDHKLTEIKSRFKDHYYNKGYKQGKADAEKELHDKFMRAIPEPWK